MASAKLDKRSRQQSA